jgi:hypothetical protein
VSMKDTSLTELVAGKHHLERIEHLIGQPEHDMEWLKLALQSAVSVEFSTIPPYLCALWSIKDENDEVAKSIRNVVQEEMLHMSLACNMLTALGCVPQISDPNMVPLYPGPIPGKVHPELTVMLSGLSDNALDLFIAIEAPSQGESPQGSDSQSSYKTIGQFYDAILGAFKEHEPQLATDRQITGPLAYMVMEDLTAVEAAIALIKDQGEGSEASPVVEHTRELAHYYRFREIREGRRLSGVDENKQPIFDGPVLERPEVWPVAVVPKGGYLQKDVPADVWKLVNGVDQTFTQLLNRLQVVWEHGDQGALVHAIDTMFGLSQQARSLMSIKIEGESGNYGPCFRFLEGSRQID